MDFLSRVDYWYTEKHTHTHQDIITQIQMHGPNFKRIQEHTQTHKWIGIF